MAIATVVGYDSGKKEIFRNADCKVEEVLGTFRKGFDEAAFMSVGFVRLNETLTFSTERSAFQANAEFPGHFMTHNDRRRNNSEGYVNAFPRLFHALQPPQA